MQQQKLRKSQGIQTTGYNTWSTLELQSHVNKILKDRYSTLQTLKLGKRYIPYYLGKKLWESLILSKLDYCNILFKTLPQYQKNRMEKLLQSYAGFVKFKYPSKNDVINSKWLFLEEQIDSSILKLVCNGTNKENMRANLKLELKKSELEHREITPS